MIRNVSIGDFGFLNARKQLEVSDATLSEFREVHSHGLCLD